ncbi:MAG TPA: hypothetical protein VLJ86_27670 [Ramlibacter sp.]|nr:hypothetical protein [Ramlibacter sp.]
MLSVSAAAFRAPTEPPAAMRQAPQEIEALESRILILERQRQAVETRIETRSAAQTTLRAQAHGLEAAIRTRRNALRDQLRDANLRNTITPSQSIKHGLSAAGQAALREILPQTIGQGVTVVARSALIDLSGRSLGSLYATQLLAAAALALFSVRLGARAADLVLCERPPTRVGARTALAMTPLVIQAGTLMALERLHSDSMVPMIKLLSAMTARLPGATATALVAQAQYGVWGTVRTIAPDTSGQARPDASAPNPDALRFTLTSVIYAIASVLLLVYLTDWLAARIGGDSDSLAFDQQCLASLPTSIAKVGLAMAYQSADVLSITLASVAKGPARGLQAGTLVEPFTQCEGARPRGDDRPRHQPGQPARGLERLGLRCGHAADVHL